MNLVTTYFTQNYKKIIGWGTSAYYHNYKSDVPVKFEYLIDKDSTKWNRALDGLLIYPPEKLLEEDPNTTLIVIFSSYYVEISKEIKSLGRYYILNGEQLANISSLFMPHKRPIVEIEDNVVLTISRTDYTKVINGTSKVITEQGQSIMEQNKVHIHLYWNELKIKNYEGYFYRIFKNGKDIGLFDETEIKGLINQVKVVIIHNVTDLNYDILIDMLLDLSVDVRIYYYLHDFSSVCTNIKLMKNDTYFCESYNNGWTPCTNCNYYDSQKKIFMFHKDLFTRVNVKLISPSEHTKSIFKKVFQLPDHIIEVLPHQVFEFDMTTPDISEQSKLRIAYVGYKHKHKGWAQFLELFKQFSDLYEFYCLGTSDELVEGIHYIDISFNRDGEDAMVKALSANKINIAFLWSTWPETYSYTYFESFAAGCCVITNSMSGNIAAQVRENKNGFIFQEYKQLMSFLSSPDKVRTLIPAKMKKLKNLRRNKVGFIELLENHIK